MEDVSALLTFSAPVNVIFEIQFIRSVHLTRRGLEDHTFLSSIGVGEFNFPVETAGTQQGRIQRIGPVRRHDDLDVR
jgi:hypothetical protein